ncbi:iron ABC transporter permease [Brevibacillus nitrificans]|uniref:Iron ABC transporter permease n=1 Tax=Brevibacillus nitrificans TaxID=651560 RepID=A0A3M8D7S8_9BACL|nr:iron ABC transporter permease [Brevibacillus nitrificans]RNB83903.1 iron ABC transporter permease [Brevibacillus nitrificans]
MNRLFTMRSKTGRFSFLVDRKTVIILTVLFVCTVAGLILSIQAGSKTISFGDVVLTLLGQGTPDNKLVIGTLRMPRVILAVLVGAALSVSGALLQGVVRNPLASPDIIGITGGAAFAAVAFITYTAGAVSVRWLPLAAFCGAALVSALIYFLAWNKGVTSTRLVLIGIGVAATTSALTMLMLVLSPITAASKAYIWMTGSIYGASWENVYSLLPWVLIFIPLALLYARNVNVQELGDDMARGLGASVQLHRVILLFISVALAGSAVAVAGAIGFIGLIAPHIARKLVGSSHGGLIPVAALIGSLMLLLADTVARTLFQPQDIPAGVFTASIGAPFFIYLLYKNRNQ